MVALIVAFARGAFCAPAYIPGQLFDLAGSLSIKPMAAEPAAIAQPTPPDPAFPALAMAISIHKAMHEDGGGCVKNPGANPARITQ